MPFPPDPSPPDPQLPQDPPQGQGSLPLRGLSLLVVDDSRFTCDALRLILHRAGARLRRAGSVLFACSQNSVRSPMAEIGRAHV